MSWKHYAGTTLFIIGLVLAVFGASAGLAGNIDQETMWGFGILGIITFSIGLVLLFIEKYGSKIS